MPTPRTIGLLILFLTLASPQSHAADQDTVDKAELKMLRATVERLAKENTELRAQVASLKERLGQLEPLTPSDPATPATQPSAKAAKKIIFIVDSSNSSVSFMGEAAGREAVKAIFALQPDQSFNLLLAQGEASTAAFPDGLVPATEENKVLTDTFAKRIRNGGADNIPAALRSAYKMRPDVIWLASDGDIDNPAILLREVRRLHTRTTRINTVTTFCKKPAGVSLLWQISQITGGTCLDDKGNPISQPSTSSTPGKPAAAPSIFKGN